MPWRDTNKSPLTGDDLRTIVLEASQLEAEENNDDYLDVPGVAWLEHINLIVGETSEDRAVAEDFYLNVMGFTPDKGKSFHVNMGRQQFHLATPKRDDEVAHRIHGSVGLAVPDLDALWDRLVETKTNNGLKGTLFDFYKEEPEGASSLPIIHVRCPWGNVFRCYSANDRGPPSSTTVTESPQKMTNLHSNGGYGADKMGVLAVGEPGIRYIEFLCPKGVSADQICSCYQTNLHCPSRVIASSDTRCCVVSVGSSVHLVFVETDTEHDDDAWTLMKGIHICIYTHEFRALYHRLAEKSLIWTNPRFTHLDTCDTWEEAKQSRTLRFRHLIGTDDTSSTLMELEHETRPLRHGQFMKVPYYIPK